VAPLDADADRLIKASFVIDRGEAVLYVGHSVCIPVRWGIPRSGRTTCFSISPEISLAAGFFDHLSTGRVFRVLSDREIASARSGPLERICAMADALLVHCRPLEETRGPNSSCEWLAECEVDGRRFAVRSRHGVVYELARMLVTARIEDRPLSVTFAGVASMMYGSFVAAARWTLTEGAATLLHRTPWREFRR
jgi:hypothetical protein